MLLFSTHKKYRSKKRQRKHYHRRRQRGSGKVRGIAGILSKISNRIINKIDKRR